MVESRLWKHTVTGRGLIITIECVDVDDTLTDAVLGIVIENGYVCLLNVIRNHIPTLNSRLTKARIDSTIIGIINARPRSDDGYLYEILDQIASYPLASVQYINNTLIANDTILWPLPSAPN